MKSNDTSIQSERVLYNFISLLLHEIRAIYTGPNSLNYE